MKSPFIAALVSGIQMDGMSRGIRIWWQLKNAPTIFLSGPRMTSNALAREDSVRRVTGGRPCVIKPFNATDVPEHQPMRAVIRHYFTAAKVKQLKFSTSLEARRAIARMGQFDASFDLARQVAFEYLLRIIVSLVGVPESGCQVLFKLTKQLVGPADPACKRPAVDLGADPAGGMKEICKDLRDYVVQLLSHRQRRPELDLVSDVATAGRDATGYSLSEAVYRLALDAELVERLSGNPESASPRIAEEAFRLAAATSYFIRTISRSVTVSGAGLRPVIL